MRNAAILLLCTSLLTCLPASGQKAALFGGYQLTRLDFGGPLGGTFTLNGWNASLTGGLAPFFGITADFSGLISPAPNCIPTLLDRKSARISQVSDHSPTLWLVAAPVMAQSRMVPRMDWLCSMVEAWMLKPHHLLLSVWGSSTGWSLTGMVSLIRAARLRGHIKSGQRWSLQNRPTKVAWD